MRIEQHLVNAWSEKLTDQLIGAAIANLKRMTSTALEDQRLASVWDEICLQKKAAETLIWPIYERTIDEILFELISALDKDEQAALWAVTTEGWDFIYDHHADPKGHSQFAPNLSDILVMLRAKLLKLVDDSQNVGVYRAIWGL